MKKTKIFLGMMIASLLIGCNNVQENANNAVRQSQKDITPIENKELVVPVPEQSQMTTPDILNQENSIGEEKAKEIALSKVPNGVMKEFSFDYDDYIPNYDIKVSDSTYEYDFEINAVDGSIVERDKEKIERYDD